MIGPAICALLLAVPGSTGAPQPIGGPLLAQDPAPQQTERPEKGRPELRQLPRRPPSLLPPGGDSESKAKLSRGLREARNLVRRGRYEEALARLDLIEAEGSRHEDYQLLRGTCLRKLGRFEKACELYRAEADRLVAEGLDPTQMLIELERALREKKDPDGAFVVCLELHRRGGGTGIWVRDEMESLIQVDGLGERALPMLRQAIEEHAGAPDLQELYVGALFFMGRFEEWLQEAILLDRARNASGRILLDQLRIVNKRGVGEPALAMADAATSEGLTGDELQEAHLLRAHTLRRLRRHQEAAETYQQAATASPDGPLTRLALRDRADLLVRDLGELEEGERAWEALIASLERASIGERGRLLSQALVSLADCRLRMGSYEGASEVLRRVEEQESNVASKEEAAFQQAEILFYSGSVEEAKAGYERVVAEFKGGNRVNDALERLLLLRRTADASPVPLAALGQIAYHRRVGSPQRSLEISIEAAQLCGGCAAAEDLLREQSLALLDLDRIDEAAVRADTLAARYSDGGSAPAVLRAVADRMRERDGGTEAVLRRYEDLVTRFPKSHEAFEVRSLLRDLRRDRRSLEEQPGEEVG